MPQARPLHYHIDGAVGTPAEIAKKLNVNPDAIHKRIRRNNIKPMVPITIEEQKQFLDGAANRLKDKTFDPFMHGNTKETTKLLGPDLTTPEQMLGAICYENPPPNLHLTELHSPALVKVLGNWKTKEALMHVYQHPKPTRPKTREDFLHEESDEDFKARCKRNAERLNYIENQEIKAELERWILNEIEARMEVMSREEETNG
jgi:hypothetical protein